MIGLLLVVFLVGNASSKCVVQYYQEKTRSSFSSNNFIINNLFRTVQVGDSSVEVTTSTYLPFQRHEYNPVKGAGFTAFAIVGEVMKPFNPRQCNWNVRGNSDSSYYATNPPFQRYSLSSSNGLPDVTCMDPSDWDAPVAHAGGVGNVWTRKGEVNKVTAGGMCGGRGFIPAGAVVKFEGHIRDGLSQVLECQTGGLQGIYQMQSLLMLDCMDKSEPIQYEDQVLTANNIVRKRETRMFGLYPLYGQGRDDDAIKAPRSPVGVKSFVRFECSKPKKDLTKASNPEDNIPYFEKRYTELVAQVKSGKRPKSENPGTMPEICELCDVMRYKGSWFKQDSEIAHLYMNVTGTRINSLACVNNAEKAKADYDSVDETKKVQDINRKTVVRQPELREPMVIRYAPYYEEQYK